MIGQQPILDADLVPIRWDLTKRVFVVIRELFRALISAKQGISFESLTLVFEGYKGDSPPMDPPLEGMGHKRTFVYKRGSTGHGPLINEEILVEMV